MKRIKIVILLVFAIFLFACKKEKKENFLEGPLTIENKNGTYLLYDRDKPATGILKGKDMIIGLNYDMYYTDGMATGKVNYFNGEQKIMEVDMEIDYPNDIAKGTVKIYDYNENKIAKVGMQYLNIISKPENFIDLDNARPTLKWYLENPVNVFSQVDILNGETKISSIKDEKYFFYDEEGSSYEVPMLKGEPENIDEFLIYAEEDDKILIDESDENITYTSTDKSVEKIKIGAVFGNGMFKVVDENNNSFVIEYNLGTPSGNFEIDSSSENGGFKIYGNGKYQMTEDLWQGDIRIYTEDENFVELKNTKILGENLYREKNIIEFSWINISPTKDKPLDLEKVSSILEADVYFNEEIIGKIINGTYRTLN
ncbi:MAG: hypothetical protein IJG31_02940 [Fusobacterium sp.]|nr:hypothetical protein [Fusobacterium sp.]